MKLGVSKHEVRPRTQMSDERAHAWKANGMADTDLSHLVGVEDEQRLT
jgi:hypothetical protein